jgi:glycosyltransferase involved in cell wall biosynthesis
MKLHIGITGCIATEHVVDWLSSDDKDNLPIGKPGAPLTGVLIGELLKQGHKVSAFTTDPALYSNSDTVKLCGPNFDFYICPARPHAWRFNGNRLGRAVDFFAFEREQLLSAIKLANPDIIHAHWTYEFALAAIKSGLPHLVTCHDAPAVILHYSPGPYRFIHYMMARLVFNKGKFFSTVSPYMTTKIKHYTKAPIAIIPNPIADYVIANGRKRNDSEKKRIGLVCNGWSNFKNPKPALKAFSKLHGSQPNLELHLFGLHYGINEAAQKWCIQQGLTSGIVFHGELPHKQLIKYFNELDLLLHPALEESFSVVIAEAMALGLPIVAGRYTGAVPWVVGMDAALNKHCSAVLTDVTDPDMIIAAIIEAFDQHYSERSEFGYARARRLFTPSVISESYMALYRQILFSINGKAL